MKYAAFSYKNGSSFFHRMPAWIKIIFITVINIAVFKLHFSVALSLLAIQFVIAFGLHFTLKEQLADLKPVIYYAFLLYILGFTGRFCSLIFSSDFIFNQENLISAAKVSFDITFKNYETLLMLLKLFCMMQTAGLIFKTSTSLQIREGVGKIETTVRKILHLKKKNSLTNTISMFICFIPMVYRNWEQCKRAWFARGGKHSVKMYISILPVFFSVGIKQAWNTSRAVLIRESK